MKVSARNDGAPTCFVEGPARLASSLSDAGYSIFERARHPVSRTRRDHRGRPKGPRERLLMP